MPPTLYEIFVQPLMDATGNMALAILMFVITAVVYMKSESIAPALSIWVISFLVLGTANLPEPVDGMYFGFFIVGVAAIVTNIYTNYKRSG